MINCFVDQWQRSGNPAWLKSIMIVALIILAVLLVHMIRDTIREYKHIVRQERLEQLQGELAERYKKQFNYEGRVPHGKETHRRRSSRLGELG